MLSPKLPAFVRRPRGCSVIVCVPAFCWPVTDATRPDRVRSRACPCLSRTRERLVAEAAMARRPGPGRRTVSRIAPARATLIERTEEGWLGGGGTALARDSGAGGAGG